MKIKFYHTDPTITTLDGLVNSGLCIFEPYRGKVSKLESVKGPEGKTNRQLIEATYVNPDKDNETEKWPLLKVGTVIYVEANETKRDFMSIESSGQVKSFDTYVPYFTKTQLELEQYRKQGLYVPTYRAKSFIENIAYINPHFRVWIYCKSLGQVLDVTRFVSSIETHTSLSGGDSFSLSLSYVINPRPKQTFSNAVEDVFVSNAFKEDSFFFKHITENDIVFISYETLKLERSRINPSFNVDKSELGRQYYDFLGLVSTVQQNSTAQGSGGVSISGASFEKLFIDDEAVYRPISVIGDSFSGNLLFGDKKRRGWFARMFADGKYQSMLTHRFRTIETTMKFFMNMISNVGFLPLADNGLENTTLFSSYKYQNENGVLVDDRSYLFSFDESGHANGGNGAVTRELAKGIYQIVKLSVDPQLQRRKLTEASVVNPQGSVLSLFRACCQKNLTEMFMDTFKNTFDIIVRVPPFTLSALKGLRDSLFEIEVEDVASDNLSWENNFYTWYEFQPKGSMIAYSAEEAMAYIPVLFLSEFIGLWGSKCLSVVSPYGDGEVDSDRKQAVQDLCWLVEANFYLPFTRKGTITLAVPDRRIRKGMWIRYKKTGEIFYVEGVSQSASVSVGGIQRGTTITVSRGMVEKYVFDEQKGYFSIIDFKALAEQVKGITERNDAVSFVPTVNGEVFKFFVQRKQFE